MFMEESIENIYVKNAYHKNTFLNSMSRIVSTSQGKIGGGIILIYTLMAIIGGVAYVISPPDVSGYKTWILFNPEYILYFLPQFGDAGVLDPPNQILVWNRLCWKRYFFKDDIWNNNHNVYCYVRGYVSHHFYFNYRLEQCIVWRNMGCIHYEIGRCIIDISSGSVDYFDFSILDSFKNWCSGRIFFSSIHRYEFCDVAIWCKIS